MTYAKLLPFLLLSISLHAQPGATLATETPAKVTIPADAFSYTRQHVMIPMRDGVKLFTVVLTPKGARRAPILLTRPPYDAKALSNHAQSSRLGPILQGYEMRRM